MTYHYFRYGIGAIYQKQERYELAEMHYKRALRINHSSALIMCHIAVVSIINSYNLNQKFLNRYYILYYNYITSKIFIMLQHFFNRYKIVWTNLTKRYILYTLL